MKVKVILAAIALVAGTSLASAQSTNQPKNNESRKSCYVDKNKNGICDKHENGTCKTGSGKGLQDGTGKGKGLQNGNGKGKCGVRHGQKGKKSCGKSANYADVNKNGICDRREEVKK